MTLSRQDRIGGENQVNHTCPLTLRQLTVQFYLSIPMRSYLCMFFSPSQRPHKECSLLIPNRLATPNNSSVRWVATMPRVRTVGRQLNARFVRFLSAQKRGKYGVPNDVNTCDDVKITTSAVHIRLRVNEKPLKYHCLF